MPKVEIVSLYNFIGEYPNTNYSIKIQILFLKFKNNLHHFIIEGGGLSFFIYIHHMFFEEKEPIEILNEFYKYHVIDTINKSTKPIWLYLSISGLQEVDGNFIGTKPT